MGQAFHRKQLSSGRGPKTRGTGIGYLKPAPVQVPGAPREKTNRMMGIRESNIYILMRVACSALDKWEDNHEDRRPIYWNGEDRDFALEEVVDRAYKIVSTAVTKCCDRTGIDVERLLGLLQRPRQSPQVMAAVAAVRQKFTSVFSKLERDGDNGESREPNCINDTEESPK